MPVFTTIGAAIFGAGTFMAAVTAAGLQIVAGIAFSAIGKAMQGDQTAAQAKFGVQGKLQGGDDVPRSINLGWNCTAGSLVYHNTWGAGGVMSARVMALGDYPIQQFVGVEVDGVAQTLLTGETHASYGWPVAGFRKGGKDHLWIKFYDGTQTTADPYLVGSVSSVDRPYSSSRIGYGVPYVIVTALAPEREDGEEKPLFQGLPSFKFITYGAKWYDPSKDTTVGGSGLHRWNDPATWGGDGDFLPPVQIYNLLRGVYFNSQWLYGLQSVNAARVDNATFIAAINKARSTIAGPSGLEPTFRAGGEVQVGAQVHQAIEALITSCNGRLVEVGGTYKLYVGEPGAAVMSFTDGDIISTEEQSFSPFLRLSDTVNGVAASYPNPTEGWNTKTAPPLLRPDLETLDGNRRLMASVSLDFVPYPGQVQRLMKWALAEALRARRHTFVLGPEFRVIEPGDVVMWSSARNGYENKLFRVDGVVYKSNLDVIVDLTEVDPSDYDWNQATDFRPVIDGPISLVGPRPMPMSGWQVFPAAIVDDQGRNRRPSVEVWAASGLSGVDRVRVQVRVGTDIGPLIFDSDSQPYGTPWKWILQGQFSADTLFVVRGIFVGPANAEWSGWLAVTTPDIRLTDLDFVYGRSLDGLETAIEGYFDWMGGNIRDVIEKAQEQDLLGADQELANAMQFDEMRRSLSVVTGDLSASFEETITVAIVPMQGELVAIADQLTTLTAEVDDVASSVTVRGTAQTSPGGGWARWGVEVKTGSGDVWSSGAFFIDTNGATSRAAFVVDQFVVNSGSVVATPFIFDGSAIRVANAFIAELTAVNIKANSITGDRITAGTITADRLSATNLSAISADMGTLTAGTISLAAGKLLIDGPNNRILVAD